MNEASRRRPGLQLLVLLLALGLLAFAGCGSDDTSDTSTPPASTDTSTQTDTSITDNGGSAKTTDVAATGVVFDPVKVDVAVGDTVTWTNKDDYEHNVIGDDFDGDLATKGSTFSYTFDTAGTFHYVCTIHPGMEGDVVVK